MVGCSNCQVGLSPRYCLMFRYHQTRLLILTEFYQYQSVIQTYLKVKAMKCFHFLDAGVSGDKKKSDCDVLV